MDDGELYAKEKFIKQKKGLQSLKEMCERWEWVRKEYPTHPEYPILLNYSVI